MPRGLIGPARQFGTGSVYHPHLYAIIVGVFIPVPFYLWQRRYPDSWARYVSMPVVIAGLSGIPPAMGINYSSWSLVTFIFPYVIRKKNFVWWSKLNYVLSSALDSRTIISIMVTFFALQVGCLFLYFWMDFECRCQPATSFPENT
jgi:OPT oligopeptide transporter protein